MKPSALRIAAERKSTRGPWHGLDEGQVRRLCEAHRDGVAMADLVARFRVCADTIRRIVRSQSTAEGAGDADGRAVIAPPPPTPTREPRHLCDLTMLSDADLLEAVREAERRGLLTLSVAERAA